MKTILIMVGIVAIALVIFTIFPATESPQAAKPTPLPTVQNQQAKQPKSGNQLGSAPVVTTTTRTTTTLITANEAATQTTPTNQNSGWTPGSVLEAGSKVIGLDLGGTFTQLIVCVVVLAFLMMLMGESAKILMVPFEMFARSVGLLINAFGAIKSPVGAVCALLGTAWIVSTFLGSFSPFGFILALADRALLVVYAPYIGPVITLVATGLLGLAGLRILLGFGERAANRHLPQPSLMKRMVGTDLGANDDRNPWESNGHPSLPAGHQSYPQLPSGNTVDGTYREL